jgi:hypothetical protein
MNLEDPFSDVRKFRKIVWLHHLRSFDLNLRSVWRSQRADFASSMNSPSYERYVQWLGHVKQGRPGMQNTRSFAITLSPELGHDTARIGEDLVEYLNEFDENAAGYWAVFDAEALRQIEKRGGVDHLPNWVKHPSGLFQRHSNTRGHQALVRGMASLGTVVLVENQAYLTTQAVPRVFHTRLTHPTNRVPEEDARPFHLLVNMGRFGPESMVSIIGDSALEWASRGHDPMDRVVEFSR